MTDTNRLDIIQTTFRKLLQAEDAQGTEAAQKELEDLNVSAEEFIKLANRKDDLPADFNLDNLLIIPEDEEWEEDEREHKEADDLEQFAEPAEHEEKDNHECYTCGSASVSYEMEGQICWTCEDCYYARENGYGETGLDWNESGYFD
jgi:hypothetical protein